MAVLGALRANVAVAVRANALRIRRRDGLRATQQGDREMTMASGVGVAVQVTAVSMNVRVKRRDHAQSS
jgi:hypothetical protein